MCSTKAKKKVTFLFDLILKTSTEDLWVLYSPSNPKEVDQICFSRWDISLPNGFRAWVRQNKTNTYDTGIQAKWSCIDFEMWEHTGTRSQYTFSNIISFIWIYQISKKDLASCLAFLLATKLYPFVFLIHLINVN